MQAIILHAPLFFGALESHILRLYNISNIV